MSNDKGRTRVWATIVYPDSCAEDWLEILGEECIPCLVSPLHNQDFNPDGEVKKSHYHVLFNFDGVKSYDQVKDICERIKGVEPKKVNSFRGYARYLCHLDNPEKHQYDVNKVRSIGGIDYMNSISLSSDKYTTISEMMLYCDENDIYSYATLLRYASTNRYDWFRVLCDNGTVVMKEYLKSLMWERKK